jgi:hypothetical protein
VQIQDHQMAEANKSVRPGPSLWCSRRAGSLTTAWGGSRVGEWGYEMPLIVWKAFHQMCSLKK